MNIAKVFIDRPIFAGVLSTLIFLSGLIAMFQLPISEYPEVVPPSVVVIAQFPGANPKVIAETVATPLEEQINGVDNMLYMYSQSTSDGKMTLTVTFELGTDPESGPTVGSEPGFSGGSTLASRDEAVRSDDDQKFSPTDDGCTC